MSQSTITPEVPTLTQLIDEGSKKFKYGLLWWFVYPYFSDSDYGYIDWLTYLTEKQIHDKLLEAVSYFLSWDFTSFGSDRFTTYNGHDVSPFQYLMKGLKQHSVYFSVGRIGCDDSKRPGEGMFDLVEFFSECLYKILVEGETTQKWKITHDVWHACNRVIRNYSGARMVQGYPDSMSIVSDYYTSKSKTVKCGW